jgi:hypothetical protein
MDMQFRALRFYTGTTASASAVDVNITDLPSYERMCILSNGNVGIGTSSPSIALDVPGGIATPGYHAQHTTTCSGLVKWTGTHLSWLHRCIALPVEKTEFSSSGYISMFTPASGTSITYYNGTTGVSSITTTADGFPVGQWQALWYIVTPGQANGTVNSQYVITDYPNDTWKPNSNWILLAAHNGDTAGGGSTYLKFMPTNGNFYKWIALPFVNSWADYGSTYTTGAYYRDGDGVVHLRGLIKNGTSTTICTLPEGFRPEGRLLTHCISNGYPASRIDIKTTGVVTLEHSTYDAGWLSLEGISFKAYQ